jgi:hypothetical protein
MIRKVTIGLIAAVILVISGYDIWAFVQGGVGATISMVIATTSYNHPVVAWCGGVLTAHFFWPGEPAIKSNKRYFLLVGTAVIVGLAGVIFSLDIIPIGPAIFGVCCGRLLWAQPRQ